VFSVSDKKGAKCHFALTVNILDTNANPNFQNDPYSGTITELDVTDTTILTVTATDPDIGINGVLTFSVAADANKPENNFKLKKLTATTASLRVKSPKDREAMSGNVINFNIVVKDGGGGSDTAVVTMTVENKNDNVPMFTKSLYNFEMMYNDTKGHVVGSVSCTDKDVGKIISWHY
jgi:hypothetical protein